MRRPAIVRLGLPDGVLMNSTGSRQLQKYLNQIFVIGGVAIIWSSARLIPSVSDSLFRLRHTVLCSDDPTRRASQLGCSSVPPMSAQSVARLREALLALVKSVVANSPASQPGFRRTIISSLDSQPVRSDAFDYRFDEERPRPNPARNRARWRGGNRRGEPFTRARNAPKAGIQHFQRGRRCQSAVAEELGLMHSSVAVMDVENEPLRRGSDCIVLAKNGGRSAVHAIWSGYSETRA